jgi:hypothetical protein
VGESAGGWEGEERQVLRVLFCASFYVRLFLCLCLCLSVSVSASLSLTYVDGVDLNEVEEVQDCVVLRVVGLVVCQPPRELWARASEQVSK